MKRRKKTIKRTERGTERNSEIRTWITLKTEIWSEKDEIVDEMILISWSSLGLVFGENMCWKLLIIK